MPDPLEAHRAALGDWLARHVEGFSAPFEVEPLSGGQSNPTYRIRAASGDTVLRRKPDGVLLPSAHAVDREHRVIGALHAAGLPVPRIFGYCDDPAVLPTPFFVMEFVAGRIFFDPRLPDVAREERAAMFDAMNATLARMHALDPAAIGLGDFGRPGNYMARQIERWTRQYRASETRPIEAMERLMEWLPRRLAGADDAAVSVVHGDCRMDNFVFHPEEPRVVAVLDWELSTLGSPLADFAYNVMAWRITPALFRGLAGSDLAALGVPTEAEYVAAYCARTGRAALPDLDFYIAFNLFRLAAIMQGIAKRVLDGTAAGADAEENGRKAAPIAELGWAQALRAEAA
jgi:aminoglycoside phosphotransferase (APT) family kinase protein